MSNLKERDLSVPLIPRNTGFQQVKCHIDLENVR
jgi:hypothetical protein